MPLKTTVRIIPVTLSKIFPTFEYTSETAPDDLYMNSINVSREDLRERNE